MAILSHLIGAQIRKSLHQEHYSSNLHFYINSHTFYTLSINILIFRKFLYFFRLSLFDNHLKFEMWEGCHYCFLIPQIVTWLLNSLLEQGCEVTDFSFLLSTSTSMGLTLKGKEYVGKNMVTFKLELLINCFNSYDTRIDKPISCSSHLLYHGYS